MEWARILAYIIGLFDAALGMTARVDHHRCQD
jgi:hypothetical protein